MGTITSLADCRADGADAGTVLASTPVTVRELGYSARNLKEHGAPIGAPDGPNVA